MYKHKWRINTNKHLGEIIEDVHCTDMCPFLDNVEKYGRAG
jgi:hypothetical protein